MCGIESSDIIAICALFVSILTAGLSICKFIVEYKPKLVYYFNSLGDERKGEILLFNKGLGTAVIEDVKVFFNNEPVIYKNSWLSSIFAKAQISNSQYRSSVLWSGAYVSRDDETLIGRFKSAFFKNEKDIHDFFKRIRIEIRFSSLLPFFIRMIFM
jgi:hypothetical protein